MEKEDTYSFAINSTSYSLLTIDDIPILEWNYIHNKSNDWEKVAEKKLTPGKHILKFYAHIGEKSQYAAAAWKKPGEDKFSIIKFDDFYSPQELSIKSCYSKNTNKVPLVKGKYIGKIYTDRLNYLNLADCSVITNVSDIIPEWKLNSTKLHTGLSLQFLVQNETNDELILSYPSEDNTYDLEFKIPLSKLKKNDSVISPEIFMDLSIPLFLFDDELLEINTSIYSLVQQEIKTIFKVQSFPENELISSYTEFLELPAKQQTGDKIFSSPEIIKRNFKLDGKKISNQVILAKFSITIPPIEIKETYISIIPLERLNNFSSDGIFLTDSRDRRIIVKLHRPTLSEKREWSFVDSISNELKLFPKTLIISDDFGVENNTFFKNLSTHIGKTTQLDFIEWKSKKNNSTMLANLSNVIEKLRKTDAKRIIIIPSSMDTVSAVSARTQSRIICALLQTARENKNVSELILCTPFPQLNTNYIEEEFIKNIKTNIKEDFAVDKIIDLNYFIKSKDHWQSYYRDELNSPHILTSHPKFMTELISTFIANSL